MPKLGLLYRKYLRGSDLNGQVFAVKIVNILQVVVHPPPAYQEVTKWCLKVSGLPEDLPPLVLLGPSGENDLVKIFGQVNTNKVRGKMIELVPKTAPIAGRDKVMITFRKPANAEPPSDDEEVVQFTDDDDAPF